MSVKFLKLVYAWDYRMRWAPIERPVERGMGGRSYPYGTETFLDDYTRAFAWLSRHGYDGVVIWGFLRDSHGGVQAAHELCHRADDYGIRVIAGVGVNCYAGIYWEGDNPYNINNRVKQHPEMAAVGADSKPVIRPPDGEGSMLCPSRSENLQWHLDGLSWLLEEVPLHGIFYETGDYGMCHCPRCKSRPGQIPPYSYADWGDVLPSLMKHVHSLSSDVLQIGACYGTIPHYISLDLGLVEDNLPDYAWCSWSFEGGVGWASAEQDPWRSVVREPSDRVRSITGRDIGLLAYNSYAGYDEGLVYIERIRTACRMCRERDIHGLMMMGELSEPSNLMNYMALEFFLKNPQANIWDCLDYTLTWIRSGNSQERRRIENVSRQV